MSTAPLTNCCGTQDHPVCRDPEVLRCMHAEAAKHGCMLHLPVHVRSEGALCMVSCGAGRAGEACCGTVVAAVMLDASGAKCPVCMCCMTGGTMMM